MSWSARSKSMMAWAVTAAGRRATYIGELPRERSGLACDCVCPACGGRLQAVNAGQPLTHFETRNTLRPHFRHDTGQQSQRCLIRVAQIAALQLLMTQDLIDLPAPTARLSAKGVSGHLYEAEAKGEPLRCSVVSRRWVDEQEATVTLANGRTVVIRLFGRPARDSDNAAHAVISIRIDDPEVSTWSPKQILENAQLTGAWLCWERHWQDKELQQQALSLAEKQARQYLDHLPAGAELPDGQNQLQRSETVLHWAIKGMLETASALQVPACKEQVTRLMPDGDLVSKWAGLNAMRLNVTDVRVEHRLGDMVPDVICRVEDSAGKMPAMDLLIEVAVTHRVDHVKQQKIMRADLACLEIDIHLLPKSGRTTNQELSAMVLGNASTKRWIHHPLLNGLKQAAQAELNQRATEMSQAIAENEARIERLESLDVEQSLQELLGIARQSWVHQGSAGEAYAAAALSEMASILGKKGHPGLGVASFCGEDGLLGCLERIRHSRVTREPALAVFKAAMHGDGPIRRQITTLGAAMRIYAAKLSARERAEFDQLKLEIRTSLRAGNDTYARPDQYDAAISMLYPELRDALLSGKGTMETVRRIRAVKREQEREHAKEQQRLEDIAQEERRRLARQEAIEKEIQGIGALHEWMSIGGWPKDLDMCIVGASQALGKGSLYQGVAWRDVIASAWSARDAATPIDQWLRSTTPGSNHDINIRLFILDKAWLSQKRKPALARSR